MPQITDSLVKEKLAQVRYPGFSRDIVSFGLLKDIRIEGDNVRVQMTLTTSDARIPQQIKESAETALRELPGVGEVTVKIDIHAPAQTPSAASMGASPLPGVKHVIAVD